MRRRVTPRLIAVFGFTIGFSAIARAEFIPGHVFVTDAPWEFCSSPEDTGSDRIYEIDPSTGEVSVFVEMPVDQCLWLNGLAFTPDGKKLRAGSLVTGWIVEFDSEGNWEFVLGPGDGLLGPWGGNCIAYDKRGNFYVADTGTSTLLQFPADGSSGIVRADFNDGIRERMSISFAADGDLYLARGGNGPLVESARYMLRFSHSMWEPSLFDPTLSMPSDSPRVLATDSAGYVYVRMTLFSKTYRYRAGDPSSREFVTSHLNVFVTPLCFSLAETEIFFVNLGNSGGTQLSSIDIRDGSLSVIATFPASFTEGMAVAPMIDRALGDVDADGDVDLDDVVRFNSCRTEPGEWTQPGCGLCDLDRDIDVDMTDFARMQLEFADSNSPAPVK